MNLPKSFIKTPIIEIGRFFIKRKNKGKIFFHKKMNWFVEVFGIRFKKVGYYLMYKKTCF